MQEAIRLIRVDLGPEAAVLHTREVPAGFLPWLTGATELEVTASNEVPVASRVDIEAWRKKKLAGKKGKTATSEPLDPARENEPSNHDQPKEDKPRRRPRIRPAMLDHDHTPATNVSLHEEDPMGEVLANSAGASVSAGFSPLLASLMANELAETQARQLIGLVDDATLHRQPVNLARLRGDLIAAMARQMVIQGPIQLTPGRCRVVAMAGPTGVGKTTTIAKIAANLRLRENRRVGLITVDTFRIAAVEQLRTYAEIIDLPMEVVSSPKEMRAAITRMRGLDCVLVDTAGRSPREEIQLHELRAMLSEAAADEVHLVLSSTSGPEYLHKVLPRYETLRPTAMVLSKLDEAETLADLYPFLSRQKLGLSYFTHGQNVPGDIQPADAPALAKAMITRN